MSELNIYQRILAVMAEVDYVTKETKKVNNQYTFVSHDAVTKRLHPQFVEHGIAVIPTVLSTTQEWSKYKDSRAEEKFRGLTTMEIEVDFVNADDPKDYVTVRSVGYGMDPQDKGPGKAFSYAYKYALLKLFALETGDDLERELIDFKPDHAAHIKKVNNRYVGLTGPHETKVGLQKALGALSADIEDTCSHDELEGLLNDNRVTIIQVKKDFPRWWEGYDDFVGLEDRIDNKFKQFEKEELEHGGIGE